MDFAGLKLPFLCLHCRLRNVAIVWRVMKVMEVHESNSVWSFAGVLTLAAAAIVGTGLKSWWSMYGLVRRGVIWSTCVTERYRKKRSNITLPGPIMYVGRKPCTNQKDAHVLGIPQSSGNCSRMMMVVFEFGLFTHARSFPRGLMHL